MEAILSRVANARNVLVWRDGFSGWVEAGNVPELAPQLVKPPPLPIRPSRVPQKTMAGPISPANKEGLVGIGGWLILVAIGQVLGPLKRLASLFDYYTRLDGDLWTKFPIVFYGEAVLNISVFAIIIYTSYLFFAKSRLFPTFFVYEYVASILLLPLDTAFAAATLGAYTGRSINEFTAKMLDPEAIGQWIALIIIAAIWIPYIK
jgi:hypothetical protein